MVPALFPWIRQCDVIQCCGHRRVLEPFPSVQIVGAEQRIVSRKNHRGGGGWQRGEETLLSPSSFPPFPICFVILSYEKQFLFCYGLKTHKFKIWVERANIHLTFIGYKSNIISLFQICIISFGGKKTGFGKAMKNSAGCVKKEEEIGIRPWYLISKLQTQKINVNLYNEVKKKYNYGLLKVSDPHAIVL